jgi:hypothetical protein
MLVSLPTPPYTYLYLKQKESTRCYKVEANFQCDTKISGYLLKRAVISRHAWNFPSFFVKSISFFVLFSSLEIIHLQILKIGGIIYTFTIYI